MMDTYPERARGIRGEGGLPAPPRPTEDERWEYIADHLRSIRWSLSVLAAISSCTVAAAVLAFFWWAMTSSS